MRTLGTFRLLGNAHSRAFLGEDPPEEMTLNLSGDGVKTLSRDVAEATREGSPSHPCLAWFRTPEGAAFRQAIDQAASENAESLDVSLRSWNLATGCLRDLAEAARGTGAGGPGRPPQDIEIVVFPGDVPLTPPSSGPAPTPDPASREEPKSILPAVAGVGALGLLLAVGSGLF